MNSYPIAVLIYFSSLMICAILGQANGNNELTIVHPLTETITSSQEFENNRIDNPSFFQDAIRQGVRRERGARAGRRRSNQSGTETNLTDKYGKSRTTRIAAETERFIKSLSCKTPKRYLSSKSMCFRIKRTSTENMRFYFANSRRNSPLTVVIPEGELEEPKSSSHAVAVVDPFPHAEFGHVVFIFYVFNMTNTSCVAIGGLHADPDICLTHATKKNCRGSFLLPNISAHLDSTGCEVNFIPHVYDEIRQETDNGKPQILECENYISGYGVCPPDLVYPDEVIGTDCGISRNSYNCPQRIRKKFLRNVGREYQACDYGVMIFGGWNKLTEKHSQIRHQENMEKMYDMFARNGLGNKTEIFYHDNPAKLTNTTFHRAQPANDKRLIRNYIKTLCRKANQFYVDSLVIYLNSPTTEDGTMLLWDNNGNGKAENEEVYSAKELLDDLTRCKANHTYIMADQSFSDKLRSAFELKSSRVPHRKSWKRVMIVTDPQDGNFPFSTDATSRWSNLRPDQAFSSLEQNEGRLRNNLPTFQNHPLSEDLTIYGISVIQVQSEVEAKEHLGCQTLRRLNSINFNKK